MYFVIFSFETSSPIQVNDFNWMNTQQKIAKILSEIGSAITILNTRQRLFASIETDLSLQYRIVTGKSEAYFSLHVRLPFVCTRHSSENRDLDR